MKKLYIFALALAASIGFTACSDQLNIEKLGNLGDEKDFYKTDKDADEAITSCYTDLGTMYEPVKCIDDLLSDDIWCGGGQRNDNAQREDLGSYTFGSTNELVQTMFENLYTMIYDANLVLERFEAFDTPMKKRAQAEAYFFRGFAHFYLGAYFGTAPVVDHLIPKGEYGKENSTREQLYAQAVKDLKAAVESGALTRKANVTAQQVRISQQAAEAMLGKAYLFAGDTQNAATYLNKVVNSGLYRLNEGAYENLLHKVNDYDPEHVISWNAVTDFNNLTWNLYYLYRGFRGEFYNWGTTNADLNNTGYGFFNPTKDLYNAFVAEEGKEGYRLNQTIKTEEQLKDYGITLIPGKTLHGHEGYWNWKQRMLNSDYIVYGGFAVVNYNWMRYAEVLMLAAEANFKSGNTAEALKDLNAVRKRAKLPDKASITLDDIKTEKRLELWGEGCRWMDLVRWGDAATRLANKGKTMPGFNTGKVITEYSNANGGFVTGKNEVLPIPDQEKKLNGNIKQNPKY
ncbi:MAG: RagB/SusD family nutrient uptake outer membrane protein [Prevotella sp.]|nr:RagB/SusD family nutrient uptake outer membrane protein [Prevotella sp.]